MSRVTVDAYLDELEAALHVRGAVRRRFLRECRDHLADAAAAHGEARPSARSGRRLRSRRRSIAEVAARRGVRSTFAAVAGVLATGGSTLALIHAAAPDATAPTGWAIAFFVAAQVAAVAAALALLQALVLRRSTMPAADLRLLARRNALALVGRRGDDVRRGRGASGPRLRGPAARRARPGLCRARRGVARAVARAAARRLWARGRARPPLEDVRRLVRRPRPDLGSGRLLLATTCLAAAGAFLRDRGEHATIAGAFVTAGIEAGAVVACFVVLGPPLGLWHRRAA